MLNTVLLIAILLLLIRVNAKLPAKKPRDYLAEAMERDRLSKENRDNQ